MKSHRQERKVRKYFAAMLSVFLYYFEINLLYIDYINPACKLSLCNLKRILKIPPAGAVLRRIPLAIRKQRRTSAGRGQGNKIITGIGQTTIQAESDFPTQPFQPCKITESRQD